MYNYATEKHNLFTEEGFKTLIKVQDSAKHLLQTAGAFTADKAMQGCTGNSWTMLAAIDYLLEQKKFREVPTPASTWGQNRIFTK